MRFHALDGLRGLCALTVALFHLFEYMQAPMPTLLAHSFVLVDFFFVLSGFVLAHAFMDDLTIHGEGGLFMLRRIGRLYPLHLFILGLLVAVEAGKYIAFQHGAVMAQQPFTAGTAPDLLVSNLFLTQALGLHDKISWNFPSWSISVEFYVNLLFALVMVLPPRRGANVETVKLEKLGMSVLLLVVAGVLTVWAASLHKVMTFDAGFVRCIYGFFFGVLAQRLRAYGKDPTRNFSAHSVAALEIVLTLAVLALIKYGSYVWLFALSPPLFAAATLVVAHEKGPLSRLLLTRPFHAIGEWSYSIYMVHAFLIVQVLGRLASLAGKHGFLGLDPNLGGDGGAYLGALYGQGLSGAVLVVGLLVATTLAFSSFTFRWIEKPGRSYFNALAARRTRVLRPPRVSALNPAE